MSLFQFIQALIRAIVLFIILAASLLLSLRLFGHLLYIGRIRPFSLCRLRYSHYSDILISCSRVEFAFHIPRKSNPRWMTLKAYDYEFKDSGCHVSIAQVSVTLWFFPVLLRFTGGPWVSVELHDFRLRIFTSKRTPEWVEKLRRNLISTILMGETLRLDDFKTKVTFSTITGAAGGFSAPVETPGVLVGEKQDETRVSASAQHWHIRNWQSRIYTFGKLDAQLRRSWVDDRGSFVMIAEESRWTKVPSLVQREAFRESAWLWQLMQSIAYFPSDVFKILRDPTSTVDLYVPRTDITFDDFRLRDSELLKQGGAMLKKQWDSSRKGGVLHGLGWDSFFKAVLTFCT